NVPVIKAYQAELIKREELAEATKDVNKQGGVGENPYGPPAILFSPDVDDNTSEANQASSQSNDAARLSEQVQLERERLAAETREREQQAILNSQNQIIEQVLQDRREERGAK